MTILISGSCGFIGSNLVHWLLENTEHDVVGFDNLSTGYKDNVPITNERFTNYLTDIRKPNDVERIFKIHTPNVCYHLAAYASEGRSNYIRSFIHSNNTVGTSNIINLCLNYNCKLIFTSSIAVYSGKPPYDEETIPNPIDEYGLSKWMSEKSIQIAGEQGLDWCIIRPRNVYGERQSLWDSQRNVAGIFMYQILNNLPLTIYGDGLQKRSFTYIGDILEPLYKAIDVSNEIINLGCKSIYSVLELSQILRKLTGYKNVIHLENRHEVKEAYCNTLKSKIFLRYQKETFLEDGIKKMFEWVRLQPIREKQIPPTLEINKHSHSSII